MTKRKKNPVAKFLNTFNKPSVEPDRKKEEKKGKRKHKVKIYEPTTKEEWE